MEKSLQDHPCFLGVLDEVLKIFGILQLAPNRENKEWRGSTAAAIMRKCIEQDQKTRRPDDSYRVPLDVEGMTTECHCAGKVKRAGLNNALPVRSFGGQSSTHPTHDEVCFHVAVCQYQTDE